MAIDVDFDPIPIPAILPAKPLLFEDEQEEQAQSLGLSPDLVDLSDISIILSSTDSSTTSKLNTEEAQDLAKQLNQDINADPVSALNVQSNLTAFVVNSLLA